MGEQMVIVTPGCSLATQFGDIYPNLQLDLLIIDGDHSSAKLNANCQIMDGLKALIGKLQQQTGLAHTCETKTSKCK